MTPGSMLMVVAAGFPIMLALFVPALILAGLIGRPRPTRPRCRACRRPLGGVALLPATCPGCAASLLGRGAVRFGGYRIRLRTLLWGLGLGALLMVPAALSWFTVGSRAGTAIVNGIVVEPAVSAERYAQATAAGDESSWDWVHAHLQAEVLDDSLRTRAASDFVAAVRAGRSERVLLQVYPKLADVVDGAALGEALLDVRPSPEVVVESRTPTETALDVDWTQGGSNPLLIHGSLLPVMAITEIRVDGVAVRPRSPDGRVLTTSGHTRVRLATQALGAGEAPSRIEVDTVTAIVRDPPDWLRNGDLPGPPETWPGVLAMRRTTVLVEP